MEDNKMDLEWNENKASVQSYQIQKFHFSDIYFKMR